MSGAGAIVVIVAIALGLLVATANSLDGAQAFIACAFSWLLVSACYHAGLSVLSFVGVKPRRRR